MAYFLKVGDRVRGRRTHLFGRVTQADDLGFTVEYDDRGFRRVAQQRGWPLAFDFVSAPDPDGSLQPMRQKPHPDDLRLGRVRRTDVSRIRELAPLWGQPW